MVNPKVSFSLFFPPLLRHTTPNPFSSILFFLQPRAYTPLTPSMSSPTALLLLHFVQPPTLTDILSRSTPLIFFVTHSPSFSIHRQSSKPWPPSTMPWPHNLFDEHLSAPFPPFESFSIYLCLSVPLSPLCNQCALSSMLPPHSHYMPTVECHKCDAQLPPPSHAFTLWNPSWATLTLNFILHHRSLKLSLSSPIFPELGKFLPKLRCASP